MLSLRRSKNKVIPKFAAVWSPITSVVEALMLQLNVSTDLRMNNGFARRASCSTLVAITFPLDGCRAVAIQCIAMLLQQISVVWWIVV